MANTPSRAACELPETGLVFCAFNQTFKITKDVFIVWMQLLNAVPNSVLWLLACNPWAEHHLINEAARLGVVKARLIFAPRIDIDEHLARHAHADLFLDTNPYNAHTTCSDALWMGVPVLTCVGTTFASRVAASLIQSAGLCAEDSDALITQDLTQYYQQALHLAQHPLQLALIKQRLIAARATSQLFNTEAFAKGLEAHYQAIWTSYLAGAANLPA